MRYTLISLSLVMALGALGACATHHNNSNPNWKKDAIANCDKIQNPLQHQTCLDEIAAVEHERTGVP